MDSRHATDDLLEPAFVLPEQMSRRATCGARESAPHRLMLGILRDAVDLYLKAIRPGNRVAPKRIREVAVWFASDDRQWPFSFERICEALGFEPDYIRAGLYQHGRHSPHYRRRRRAAALPAAAGCTVAPPEVCGGGPA